MKLNRTLLRVVLGTSLYLGVMSNGHAETVLRIPGTEAFYPMLVDDQAGRANHSDLHVHVL